MSKTNSIDATRFKHSEVDELFNLVKTDKGVIICVGNNKVSAKSFKTFAQADKYIAERPYEILINVSILIQKMSHEKENDTPKSADDTKSGK